MTLIQYLIVRNDLKKAWSVGALIANSCHAAIAIIESTRNDELTQKYLSKENLENMHKCVLGTENEESLRELHTKLQAADIIHKMWIEQPENIPSCIALKPYMKEDVQHLLKDLKLFR